MLHAAIYKYNVMQQRRGFSLIPTKYGSMKQMTTTAASL